MTSANANVTVNTIIDKAFESAMAGMQRSMQNTIVSINGFNRSQRAANSSGGAIARTLNQISKESKGLSSSFSRVKADMANLDAAFKKNRAVIAQLEVSIKQLESANRRHGLSTKTGFDTAPLKAYKSQLESVNAMQKELTNTQKAMNFMELGKKFNKSAQTLSYAGMRMTYGLSLPISMFLRTGFQSLKALDKEVIRTEKLISDSLGKGAGKAMDELDMRLDKLSMKWGVSRELVQGLAGDFAEIGISDPQALARLAQFTAEFEKLGNVDITQAQQAIQAIYQQIARVRRDQGLPVTGQGINQMIDEVRGAIAFFNFAENKTTLSLKDMADAFPEVSAAATSFGLNMQTTAALLAPMVGAGFQVGASANSIKVSLQRLVAPTKKNQDIIKALTNVLGKEFKLSTKIGAEGIQDLIDGYTKLQDKLGDAGALTFFAELFGVRQGPRMEVAIKQMSEYQQELDKAGSAERQIIKDLERQINKQLLLESSRKRSVEGQKAEYVQLNKIKDIQDIIGQSQEKNVFGQFTGRAEAIQRAQELEVKRLKTTNSEIDKGNNLLGERFDKIKTESGKILSGAVFGTALTSETLEQELERVQGSLQVRYGRARESIKSIARELTIVFGDLLNAINPILEKISTWIQLLPSGTKKFIGVVLILLAALGPVLRTLGAVSQIAGTFAMTRGKGILKFKNDVVSLNGTLIESSTLLTRLGGKFTKIGKDGNFFGSRKDLKRLEKAAPIQAKIDAGEKLSASEKTIYKKSVKGLIGRKEYLRVQAANTAAAMTGQAAGPLDQAVLPLGSTNVQGFDAKSIIASQRSSNPVKALKDFTIKLIKDLEKAVVDAANRPVKGTKPKINPRIGVNTSTASVAATGTITPFGVIPNTPATQTQPAVVAPKTSSSQAKPVSAQYYTKLMAILQAIQKCICSPGKVVGTTAGRPGGGQPAAANAPPGQTPTTPRQPTPTTAKPTTPTTPSSTTQTTTGGGTSATRGRKRINDVTPTAPSIPAPPAVPIPKANLFMGMYAGLQAAQSQQQVVSQIGQDIKETASVAEQTKTSAKKTKGNVTKVSTKVTLTKDLILKIMKDAGVAIPQQFQEMQDFQAKVIKTTFEKIKATLSSPTGAADFLSGKIKSLSGTTRAGTYDKTIKESLGSLKKRTTVKPSYETATEILSPKTSSEQKTFRRLLGSTERIGLKEGIDKSTALFGEFIESEKKLGKKAPELEEARKNFQIFVKTLRDLLATYPNLAMPASIAKNPQDLLFAVNQIASGVKAGGDIVRTVDRQGRELKTKKVKVSNPILRNIVAGKGIDTLPFPDPVSTIDPMNQADWIDRNIVKAMRIDRPLSTFRGSDPSAFRAQTSALRQDQMAPGRFSALSNLTFNVPENSVVASIQGLSKALNDLTAKQYSEFFKARNSMIKQAKQAASTIKGSKYYKPPVEVKLKEKKQDEAEEYIASQETKKGKKGKTMPDAVSETVDEFTSLEKRLSNWKEKRIQQLRADGFTIKEATKIAERGLSAQERAFKSQDAAKERRLLEERAKSSEELEKEKRAAERRVVSKQEEIQKEQFKKAELQKQIESIKIPTRGKAAQSAARDSIAEIEKQISVIDKKIQNLRTQKDKRIEEFNLLQKQLDELAGSSGSAIKEDTTKKTATVKKTAKRSRKLPTISGGAFADPASETLKYRLGQMLKMSDEAINKFSQAIANKPAEIQQLALQLAGSAQDEIERLKQALQAIGLRIEDAIQMPADQLYSKLTQIKGKAAFKNVGNITNLFEQLVLFKKTIAAEAGDINAAVARTLSRSPKPSGTKPPQQAAERKISGDAIYGFGLPRGTDEGKEPGTKMGLAKEVADRIRATKTASDDFIKYEKKTLEYIAREFGIKGASKIGQKELVLKLKTTLEALAIAIDTSINNEIKKVEQTTKAAETKAPRLPRAPKPAVDGLKQATEKVVTIATESINQATVAIKEPLALGMGRRAVAQAKLAAAQLGTAGIEAISMASSQIPLALGVGKRAMAEAKLAAATAGTVGTTPIALGMNRLDQIKSLIPPRPSKERYAPQASTSRNVAGIPITGRGVARVGAAVSTVGLSEVAIALKNIVAKSTQQVRFMDGRTGYERYQIAKNKVSRERGIGPESSARQQRRTEIEARQIARDPNRPTVALERLSNIVRTIPSDFAMKFVPIRDNIQAIGKLYGPPLLKAIGTAKDNVISISKKIIKTAYQIEKEIIKSPVTSTIIMAKGLIAASSQIRSAMPTVIAAAKKTFEALGGLDFIQNTKVGQVFAKVATTLYSGAQGLVNTSIASAKFIHLAFTEPKKALEVAGNNLSKGAKVVGKAAIELAKSTGRLASIPVKSAGRAMATPVFAVSQGLFGVGGSPRYADGTNQYGGQTQKMGVFRRDKMLDSSGAVAGRGPGLIGKTMKGVGGAFKGAIGAAGSMASMLTYQLGPAGLLLAGPMNKVIGLMQRFSKVTAPILIIIAAVTLAIVVLKKTFENMGGKAKNIIDNFKAAFENIKVIFNMLVGIFKDFFASLFGDGAKDSEDGAENIRQVVGSISEKVLAFTEKFKNFFEKTLEPIIRSVLGGVSLAIKGIIGFLSSAIGFIINLVRFFKGGGEESKQAMSKSFNGMKEAAKKVFIGLITIFRVPLVFLVNITFKALGLVANIFERAADVIIIVISNLVKLIINVFFSIPKGILQIIEMIITVWTNLQKALVDLIKESIKLIIKGFFTIPQAAISLVGKLIGIFGGILTGWGQILQKMAVMFVEFGKKLLVDAPKSIPFFGKLYDVIGLDSLASKAIDALAKPADIVGNLFENVGTTITNITNSAVSTLNKGLGSAEGKALGFVDAVGDGIKDVLSTIREISDAPRNAIADFQNTLLDGVTSAEQKSRGFIGGLSTWVVGLGDDIEGWLKSLGKAESVAKGIGESVGGEDKAGAETPSQAEAAGKTIAEAINEGMKNLKQNFFDKVIDNLSKALDKFKSKFIDALQKQKDEALKFFDDQIAAIDALAEAEERLTATKEYEENRRLKLSERALQRENYVRQRALAIYEGRIDDARLLNLQEEKDKRDFDKDLQKFDQDRTKTLQSQNREQAKAVIQQQKSSLAEKFDTDIKTFEDFIENVGKYGTLTQEQLTTQFNELQKAAVTTSENMRTAFQDYYGKLPDLIQQNTDPTVGHFSTSLTALVEEAKSKYGLNTGVSNPESLLGVTGLMLTGMSDVYSQGFTNTVIPSYNTGTSALVKIGTDFADPDNPNSPQKTYSKAISDANAAVVAEFMKMKTDASSAFAQVITSINDETKKLAIAQAIRQAKEELEKTPTTVAGAIEKAMTPAPVKSTLDQAVAGVLFGDIWSQPVTDASGKPTGMTLGDMYNKSMGRYYGGMVKRFNGGKIPAYAVGGVVPGFAQQGVPALLHGGEYVINSKAVSGLGQMFLNYINEFKFGVPKYKTPRISMPEMGGQFKTEVIKTENETIHNYNFYVDNFIGEDQWFESMMKNYNVKVLPNKQKSAGLESRVVRTYNGINRGM